MNTTVTWVAYTGLILSLISLGWRLFEWWTAQRKCLVIIQRHEESVNRVESFGDGMTRVVFYVSIINNSLRSPVIIIGYDLELQWKDDQFMFLPDPRDFSPPKDTYLFAGDVLGHGYDEVLNHRVYGKGRLAPGDVLEGALLARGYETIPADYPHGSTMVMKFSAIDQDGKRHSIDCQFKVLRLP